MDKLQDESLSDMKDEETVTEVFDDRTNIKEETSDPTDEQFSDVMEDEDKNEMAQGTDIHSRLYDFNPGEHSGERKRRYGREFLLQYQFDRNVSTKPIVLPDIERHSKYRTDLYRSRKNNYYERSDNTVDNKRHSSEDCGAWPVGETLDVSSRETINYNDTCYIVVDCEGSEDEAETNNCKNMETTDMNTQKLIMNANDEPSVEGKLSTQKDQSRAFPKRKIHEECNWTRSYGKERKRHHGQVDRSDDIDHKRRRLTRGGSSENENGKSFHITNRSNDMYFGMRHQTYCSQRQKCSSDWHSKTTEHSRDKYSTRHNAKRKFPYNDDYISGKNFQPKGSNNQDADCSSLSSYQNRPVLFENGEPVQNRNETVSFQGKEHQQSPLSPVSDRSISPYADFSGSCHYQYKEKIHPGNFNCELKNPEAMVRSDIYVEEKGFQNSGNFPVAGHQTDLFGSGQCTGNKVNGLWSGFQGVPQAFPLGMGFQTQPNFQGNVTYQGGQMFQAPFPTGPYIPLDISNGYPAYQNHNTIQGRGRACQNNITVKESFPTKSEEIEYFLVSSETWNSLSADIQKKICSVIYRAIIEAEKEHLSPEDVIKMLKQNRPVQIEFETTDALIDLLKRNGDKFTLQMDTQQIFPRTNIKLCPTFTYNPRSKHDCTDLHICKYFLLENCKLQHCKFSHRLSSKHNAKILESKDLDGINEKHVKDLIRNLNNRNVSTTPLICKFYNNEGDCQKGEFCMHLHLCKHFINNDCMFRNCKRSHDLNDKQVETVLNKHGIFPNGTNHDRILFLLQATLEDGEVRLKRELSNLPKHSSDASFPRKSPDVYIRHTLAKDMHENGPGNRDATNLMETPENNFKDEKEIREQDLSPCSDKKSEQICSTTNLKVSNKNLKRLPEYIPLETESDTVDEHVRNITETDVKNDVKPQSKLDLAKPIAEMQLKQCKDVEGQDFLNLKEELKNETEIHVMPSETPRLPSWKPLYEMETSYEMTDNVDTHMTDKAEAHMTDKAEEQMTEKADIQMTDKAEAQMTDKAETLMSDKTEIQMTAKAAINSSEKAVNQPLNSNIQESPNNKTDCNKKEDHSTDDKYRNEENKTTTTENTAEDNNEIEIIENDFASKLGKTEGDVEAENKRSGLKSETMLEITNEYGRYRVRRKGDRWQLLAIHTGQTGSERKDDLEEEKNDDNRNLPTSRTDSERKGDLEETTKDDNRHLSPSRPVAERTNVPEEATWRNIAAAESDILDEIYQNFSDFVDRNVMVLLDAKKSDE